MQNDTTTSCLSSIKVKLCSCYQLPNSDQLTMMNFNQVVILVLFAAAAYAQWPFEPNEENEFMQDFRPSFETDKADRNRNPSHDTIGSSDRNRFQQYPETKDKEASLTLDDFDKASEQELTRVPGVPRPFYIQIVGNEVFVTEHKHLGNVTVLNLEGEVLRKFSIPAGDPTGLFVKGNKVLVTNHRNEIYSFSTSGELLGVQYLNSPVGVAVDQNDIMYVTEWRTGRIQVFNRDRTKSHTIFLGKTGYLRKIQFDEVGNLYVAESYSNEITVFNKCGKIIKTIQIPQKIFDIDGIHIDGDNLYVTERRRGHGKVIVMSISSGSIIKTITGLVSTSDVAVAPDGRLWIADYEDSSLLIYS